MIDDDDDDDDEIMPDHTRRSQNKSKFVNFQHYGQNTSVYTESHAEFESSLRFWIAGSLQSKFTIENDPRGPQGCF